MPRGEITINENKCKGCSYCVHFCSRGCIVITGDVFGPLGYALPAFTQKDRCTACGVCSWLCPDQAIEVYKYVESGAA